MERGDLNPNNEPGAGRWVDDELAAALGPDDEWQPDQQRGLALLRILLVGGIFAAALPGSLDYIAFLWRERTPVLLWRLDIVYACFGLFMIAMLVRMAAQLIRLAGPRWRDGL